jgi:hypothetical protein
MEKIIRQFFEYMGKMIVIIIINKMKITDRFYIPCKFYVLNS